MARHLPSFAWAECAPGVWQRDIDEVETFWAQAAKVYDTQGRKPFAITGHVSLEVDPTTPDINITLRKAWCAIRQDHPSVASRVDYNFDTGNFTRTYHAVRNDSEREAWLNATFFEISDGRSGVEFANSDPPAADLPSIFVLAPSSHDDTLARRDIILRAPHETIDGIGTLLLLGNFLKHASEALGQGSQYILPEPEDNEINNLSPPYRTAAAVPRELSAAQKARINKMASEHVLISSPSDAKLYVSVPFRQDSQVPGRHQRAEITLDQATSTRIQDACKAANATISTVFHSAVPIAMRDFGDSSVNEGMLYFRCDLLRNLRPFCTPPFNTAKHPVTAYHSGSSFGLEIEVPPRSGAQSLKDDFHLVLDRMRTFYRLVADDSDHWYLAPHIWAGMLKTLPTPERNPAPGPPPSATPSVSLSNLGRVDDILPSRIGCISVSRPWITGEEMGNGFGLFLSSHRGEINLAAAYNDAWQGEQEARAFLKDCVEVVCHSLDIET